MQWWGLGSAEDFVVTAMVKRVSIPITITAGGELQSSKAVNVFCEIEGRQTKVVEMLPEGSQVKIGDVVMQLDPSDVRDRLAAQQIKVTRAEATAKAAVEQLKIEKNLAESRIAQAELAMTLSELDKKKYLEGDYLVQLNEIRGSIALAQTDLQEAEDTVRYYHDLVKKGFRTPEQLRAKKQAVKKAEYHLNRDEEMLQVLEKFDHERQETELTAKAREAERELERAKSSNAAAITKVETDLEVAQATARLEREQLRRLQNQLDHGTVRSAGHGTVVYANSNKNRIELGAVVHFKQMLFSIPDMSQMEVKTFVHESEVKKVQAGMRCEVHVDAFRNLVLKGSVIKVANFYDSTREWLSGGVKEYETLVKIDELPDLGLKPGMTTQVTIQVGQLADELIVPMAAVAQKNGRHYCFVVQSDRVERRKVTIGENSANFVQIVEGLTQGEQVALDARYRAASELDERTPATGVPRAAASTTVASSQ